MERKHQGILLALGAMILLASIFASQGDQNINPDTQEGLASVRNELVAQIRQDGAEETYAALKERYTATEREKGHTAAHLFGEALYIAEGLGGGAFCDADFNYGCYHGFFARSIASEGPHAIAEVGSACDTVPLPSSCQHGIGHGIADYFGPNRLQEGLKACAFGSEQLASICRGGVFMEYNLPFVFDDTGTYRMVPRPLVDPEDPHAPCPSLPSEFQTSCYTELPQWWKQVYGTDFALLGGFCADVPEERNRIGCFTGIGKMLPSSADYDSARALGFCKQMPTEEGYTECVVYSAWAFISNGGEYNDAVSLCQALPEEKHGRCPRQSI